MVKRQTGDKEQHFDRHVFTKYKKKIRNKNPGRVLFI